MLSGFLITIVAALLGQQPAPRTAAASVDFEFFKTRVQPIFLKKRPGHARCVVCHEHGTPRLMALRPGAATWSDEESRKNFQVWSRLVVPGKPLASPMLKHPLARQAGGDHFHGGGKHWQSQDDPEWQTLAAWVQGDTLGGSR